MNEGPPGGSSMPGGMPPYFTVNNHTFVILIYVVINIKCEIEK